MTFCNSNALLTKDMDLLSQKIPNWALFNRGIEALSKSVAPMESRGPQDNKSMTVNDLLAKVFLPSTYSCSKGRVLT